MFSNIDMSFFFLLKAILGRKSVLLLMVIVVMLVYTYTFLFLISELVEIILLRILLFKVKMMGRHVTFDLHPLLTVHNKLLYLGPYLATVNGGSNLIWYLTMVLLTWFFNLCQIYIEYITVYLILWLIVICKGISW